MKIVVPPPVPVQMSRPIHMPRQMMMRIPMQLHMRIPMQMPIEMSMAGMETGMGDKTMQISMPAVSGQIPLKMQVPSISLVSHQISNPNSFRAQKRRLPLQQQSKEPVLLSSSSSFSSSSPSPSPSSFTPSLSYSPLSLPDLDECQREVKVEFDSGLKVDPKSHTPELLQYFLQHKIQMNFIESSNNSVVSSLSSSILRNRKEAGLAGVNQSYNVVVKEIKHSHSNPQDHCEQCMDLLNEVSVLRQLDHPQIVKLHKDKVFSLPKSCAILLPQARCDMFDYMLKYNATSSAGGNLESIKTCFRQIASALRYLHRDKRLVHGDVKPDNIFVFSENDYRLADFGFAKAAQDFSKHSHQQRGRRRGKKEEACRQDFLNYYGGRSLKYLPPEFVSCIEDKEFPMHYINEYSSDVFGLGVSLFQVLFKQVPANEEDFSYCTMSPSLKTATNLAVPTLKSAIIAAKSQQTQPRNTIMIPIRYKTNDKYFTSPASLIMSDSSRTSSMTPPRVGHLTRGVLKRIQKEAKRLSGQSSKTVQELETEEEGESEGLWMRSGNFNQDTNKTSQSFKLNAAKDTEKVGQKEKVSELTATETTTATAKVKTRPSQRKYYHASDSVYSLLYDPQKVNQFWQLFSKSLDEFTMTVSSDELEQLKDLLLRSITPFHYLRLTLEQFAHHPWFGSYQSDRQISRMTD